MIDQCLETVNEVQSMANEQTKMSLSNGKLALGIWVISSKNLVIITLQQTGVLYSKCVKLLEANGYDVEDDEYPDSIESGNDFHGGNSYLFDNQRYLRGSSHRRSWGKGKCSLSIYRKGYGRGFIRTFVGQPGEIFKGITKNVGSLNNGKNCCWVVYRYMLLT